MKITLFSLNASRSHTNLAIRILKRSLSDAGFSDVTLLERTEKERSFDTLSALVAENADLYAFSSYIWNISAQLTLAENLKKLRPNAIIAFGGPEVSFTAEEFLQKYPFVDTVLVGEGEKTIVELAKSLENGSRPRILRASAYESFVTSPLPYDQNEARHGSSLYYESARGCPYRCAYCLSGAEEFKKIRAKRVETTLADLTGFEEFENVKIIKFVDRTFNYDKKRAAAIWQGLLDERFTKQYHFEIAASLIDGETLAILKKFPKGKIQLEIGVQSTDPRVLAEINRPTDVDSVVKTIETLYRLGNMHIHADLIVGLPTDTYRSIRKSYDALFGKCHDLQLGFLKLLKGSPLYRKKDAYGYLFHSEPPYEVLSSDTLSFEETTRLKKIETVHERFVNSHRFSRAMAVLTDERSPFALIEALSDFLPDVTTLSQRDAYVKLVEFDKSLGNDSRRTALIDAITLDYLLNEQGRIPAGLPYETFTPSPEVKRALCERHPELFLPATEFYRLFTLGNFAVDRKNKLYFRI